MRPWMKVLPKRVRHVIICKWKGRYRNYCVGHGPERIRYGVGNRTSAVAE